MLASTAAASERFSMTPLGGARQPLRMKRSAVTCGDGPLVSLLYVLWILTSSVSVLPFTKTATQSTRQQI